MQVGVWLGDIVVDIVDVTSSVVVSCGLCQVFRSVTCNGFETRSLRRLLVLRRNRLLWLWLFLTF